MQQQRLPDDRRGAILSPCRTWRYALWRRWGPTDRAAAFIGLNPSTADETEDDATIRRCIGFAKRWGFDALYMLNLYAFRATHPRDLWKARDTIGPENNEYIGLFAGQADVVVAAWGIHGHGRHQTAIVLNSFAVAGATLHCLGRTAEGAPRHPVRLAYSTPLEIYQPAPKG